VLLGREDFVALFEVLARRPATSKNE